MGINTWYYFVDIGCFYTGSHKKVGHYYFCDSCGRSGPIFIIFFTVKFRKVHAQEAQVKTTTSPPICCRTPCCVWPVCRVSWSTSCYVEQAEQRDILTIYGGDKVRQDTQQPHLCRMVADTQIRRRGRRSLCLKTSHDVVDDLLIHTTALEMNAKFDTGVDGSSSSRRRRAKVSLAMARWSHAVVTPVNNLRVARRWSSPSIYNNRSAASVFDRTTKRREHPYVFDFRFRL